MEPKVQNKAFRSEETLELLLPVADQSSPVVNVGYGIVQLTQPTPNFPQVKTHLRATVSKNLDLLLLLVCFGTVSMFCCEQVIRNSCRPITIMDVD